MKRALFIFLVFLCLRSVSSAQTASDAAQSVLLDSTKPLLAKSKIDDAVQGKRLDLLMIALHNENYDVQSYCLHSIEKLEKIQQIQLLSEILLDGSIVQYSDDVPHGGSKAMILQGKIQAKLLNLSGKITKDKYGNTALLTHADANRIVIRLQESK